MKTGVQYPVTRHLLFWVVLYAVWVFVFRTWSFTLSRAMTIEFCYLIFITAGFYSVNYYGLPRLFASGRYVAFTGFILLVLMAAAGLRTWIALMISVHYFHAEKAIDLFNLYFNSLLNISLWIGIVTAGKMLIDKEHARKEFDAMQKKQIGNELDFLKAQINPHALFNSLNTVYGQINKQNQTARKTLLQFSELLRYQLYDCTAEKVSLEKELAYIQNYVDFHRLRKSDALRVVLEIEVTQTGLRVAPLLLVVLIENAFKFASCLPDYENKIDINISASQSALRCRIFNTKDRVYSQPRQDAGGIGLANLKRRLELLYPSKYQLTTENSEDFYESELILDLS